MTSVVRACNGRQARRVQLGRQRARHQRVGEREPPGAPVVDLDEALVERRLEPAERLGDVELDDAGEDVEVEPPPDDGRRRQQALGVGRQPRRASPHDVLHGVGDAGRQAGRAVTGEATIGGEQRQQLAEVERVAAGDVGQLGDEGRCRIPSGERGHPRRPRRRAPGRSA